MNEYIVEIIYSQYGEGTVFKEKLTRCKNCKYNNSGRCTWHNSLNYSWIVDDDDYCSCGERKEK